MKFRILIIVVAVVAPWSAAGLQIFSEGSTKPPQLFQSADLQDPTAVDYGYASFRKPFKKESGVYQKDPSALKLVKKSAQKPFLFADSQSDSELHSVADFSQFEDSGKIKSDSSIDLIKQYKKQQLLKKLAQLEEPSVADFSNPENFDQEKYAAKPQIPQEERAYNIYKSQLAQKDAQKFASFSQSDDQKQSLYAAKQAFYASKPQIRQEQQTYNIHKVYQLTQEDPQKFSSIGQSDDQKQAFLLKWAQAASEPVDQSAKMASQVNDAAQYYKVISTYVPGNYIHGYQFSQQPGFKLKQGSSFPPGDSNLFSFGFAKKQQQPAVVKVVKIVKSPYERESSFGTQSTGFINPFQKQTFGPKVIQKIQIVKPVHYTNTLGFKTLSPVDPIQAKPISGFSVKKVIKPLIVY